VSGFRRDVTAALARSYDLIVVGGGIYGMTLTLEAARRGLRPLLVERDDFASAASLNGLRILHGGVRYLQSMDLPRFFESVEQRGWFMRRFAPFCRALPCLMPLYGGGLKRPSVLRLALAMNDLLSRRDLGHASRVLGVDETLRRLPRLRRDGLQGCASWHDGQILSPQRLHMELLRWAADCGAVALNYVEATGLARRGSRVTGLVTSAGTFEAPVVINAAGSWCREVAARLDRDRPELMVPSLTFNVLLDVEPLADAAVALQGRRMYFVTPHRAGLTFAGTVHHVWDGRREPTGAMLDEFIGELNGALPGWALSRLNILRVTAGVLPARGPGQADMAHRSTFVRHDVAGLYSTCGVKYTTAQRFALRTLQRIFGRRPADPRGPEFGERAAWVEPRALMALDDEALRTLARDEAVTCKEDFLERRMDWIADREEQARFAARLERILDVPRAGIPAGQAQDA
jgi:glycerol-3-phosphate dehydrogenase